MIKELDYTKDFGERLAEKRNKKGFPRNVILEVTYRCNLRCRHCYVVSEHHKKELSTQEVKSVFNQLVEAGCLHVTLTGGEPLMRKDILSLIDYARRKGLFIHLFTNASLITSNIAARLSEFRLVSLEISLHSLKRERFDYFTQSAGSFEKVMKAIGLLRKRKIPLALKINITKLNLDELEDLKKFVSELNIVPEWGELMMPRLNGFKDNLALRLSPEEIFKANSILFPTAGRLERQPAMPERDHKEIEAREWKRGRLFQCGAGEKSFSITPYGELKPCPEFPFSAYSILEGSLQEGWRRLKGYVATFKPSPEYKCPDCKLKYFCGSCPAMAHLECGDMNGCPNYYRRLAELSARQHGNMAI